MITPAAGVVHPGFALVMGFLGALITPVCIFIKTLLIDDTLDAVGIHLFSGFFGEVLTGVFASRSIAFLTHGRLIGGGWIDGNWIQVPIQILGFIVTFGWTFLMSSILFLILKLLGWNVSEYEERVGLDQSQHGENAYAYEPPEDTLPLPHETLSRTHIDLIKNAWSWLTGNSERQGVV